MKTYNIGIEKIQPSLHIVDFKGRRRIAFTYKVKGVKDELHGRAEVINNGSCNYEDTVCIDPGREFWRFLRSSSVECDWLSLRKELLRMWREREVGR